MLNQTTMKTDHLQTLAVKVLWAVHSWSGRHYRRERLRQELRRIGRELAARRKDPARPAAVRH